MGAPTQKFKPVPPSAADLAAAAEAKETRIHLILEHDFYSWPTLDSPLPDSIVDKIVENRNALTLKKLNPVPASAKGPGGYSYGGKPFPVKDPVPASVTDERQKQVIERLYVEISGEGFPSAVMTGDSVLFTWGSGFAHGHTLETWVNKMLGTASGEAFKTELLNHGITLEGTTWKIVDTETKTKKVGQEAMAFLAGPDPATTPEPHSKQRQKMLTAYATVAEDYGPEVGKVQWDFVLESSFWKEAVKSGVMALPQWTPEAICYVIHCHMWGKHSPWSEFIKNTNGELAKILKQEVVGTGYYENKGDHWVVPIKLPNGTYPSGSMLSNMGHGCMYKVVQPLLDAPQAGDIVFILSKGQGAGANKDLPYVLRGAGAGGAPVLSENDQIMKDIETHHGYEINALLKYFKALGYQRVMKMRNWYASASNPEHEKWGRRPLIAMDTVLHANEGGKASWILDQCNWNGIPADQVEVIKHMLGIA